MIMRKLHTKIALCFLVIVFTSTSCGNSGDDPSPGDNSKDRQEILTHWADNIIIPAYADFKTKFDIMLTTGDAFTNSPDQNSLAEFRAAWSEAYLEWQKVELFEFGPADRYTLRNFFNIYPADVTGIADNISNPAANLELANSYARQGFPALDYLINGTGADDAGIIEFFTSGPEVQNRTGYVEKILNRMNSLLTQVISEWDSYRDTFVSETGLDIGSSTGEVVNAYVLHYERYIRSGKFGIPSGGMSGTGTPNPEKVEALYKRDLSGELAKNAHGAAMDFFNGVSVLTGEEGPSFKSYLNALDAKDTSTGTLLSEIITDQFAAIQSKLDVVSPDLYQQVQTNNQAMIDVYTEMQKLVRLLKADMTSAMSISITYTDNDGD